MNAFTLISIDFVAYLAALVFIIRFVAAATVNDYDIDFENRPTLDDRIRIDGCQPQRGPTYPTNRPVGWIGGRIVRRARDREDEPP